MELSGIRALVTRPEPFGSELQALITSHGGYALSLPMIAIKPVAIEKEIPDTLEKYDIIIFTSRFSAKAGASLVKKHAPDHVRLYAVGESTAKVLSLAGLNAEYCGSSGSEALAGLDSLQSIANRKILIIKGVGGRDYLQTVFRKRKAEVNTLDLYRRESVIYPDNHIDILVPKQKINVIVVTSNQILENLANQMKKKYCNDILVVVPSERILKAAGLLGFQKVSCAKGAGHEAILEHLLRVKKLCYG